MCVSSFFSFFRSFFFVLHHHHEHQFDWHQRAWTCRVTVRLTAGISLSPPHKRLLHQRKEHVFPSLHSYYFPLIRFLPVGFQVSIPERTADWLTQNTSFIHTLAGREIPFRNPLLLLFRRCSSPNAVPETRKQVARQWRSSKQSLKTKSPSLLNLLPNILCYYFSFDQKTSWSLIIIS